MLGRALDQVGAAESEAQAKSASLLTGETESIHFTPAEGSSEGVIANIDSIREVTNNAADGASGVPGASENGTAVTYPVTGVDNSVYEKNSEKISYEINTIKESLVKAKGSIKQLSVSVLLDSRGAEAVDYTENVRNLVSSAIGVSAETIVVESLPFNGTTELDKTWTEYNKINEKMMQWDRTRFFLLLGAGIAAAFVFLCILMRALRGGNARDDRDILDLRPALRSGTNGRSIKASISELLPAIEPSELFNESIQEKKTVEQYINTNPELVANILRSWLAEESR